MDGNQETLEEIVDWFNSLELPHSGMIIGENDGSLRPASREELAQLGIVGLPDLSQLAGKSYPIPGTRFTLEVDHPL